MFSKHITAFDIYKFYTFWPVMSDVLLVQLKVETKINIYKLTASKNIKNFSLQRKEGEEDTAIFQVLHTA